MKHEWKRRLLCLLLCFLVAGPMGAARAEGTPVYQDLLTQMGPLVPVAQTHYLLAQEVKSQKWGVYNTDGEQLIPYDYAALSYLSYQCFEAERYTAAEIKRNGILPIEALNSHALVTADGTQISDFRYGAFKIFSPSWACGLVLKESDAENSDYQIGNISYQITRCDIFYLGDHALPQHSGTEKAYLAASFTRNQFKDAAAHGPYLYIQDRQDAITAYNSAFEPLELEIKSLKESMYAIKNWAIVDRHTGEILMDGFSKVEEALTEDGTLLKAVRLDYSGNEWAGIYTLYGQELMPLSRSGISTVTNGYAVLTFNKKAGLYSLWEKRQLLPCKYDKIITSTTTVDPYLLHGYLCAETNGARFYIDAATGTEYPADNAMKNRTKLGNTYFSNVKRDSVTLLYAPDGTEATLHDGYIENLKKLRGSGYLLSADSVYKHLLVTWKGEVLLKFYNNPFIITDDDSVIIETVGGGYRLGKVVDSEE